MRSVNLACANCCAWADEVEKLRMMAEQAAAHENENAADLRVALSQIAELRAQLAEHERIATSDLRLAWASDEARQLRDQLRDVDTKRSRLLADCRDLERENASLRRRLAVGGR